MLHQHLPWFPTVKDISNTSKVAGKVLILMKLVTARKEFIMLCVLNILIIMSNSCLEWGIRFLTYHCGQIPDKKQRIGVELILTHIMRGCN